MDYLTSRRQPLIVLLHVPSVPIVEFGLLTGYEAGGVILGRSPYLGSPRRTRGPRSTSARPRGSPCWPPSASQKRWDGPGPQQLGHLAIDNALKHSRCTATAAARPAARRLGAGPSDDTAFASACDEVVVQRLQQHSRRRHRVPEGILRHAWCLRHPMGITGLARRAAAGPGPISRADGMPGRSWGATGERLGRRASAGPARTRCDASGTERRERAAAVVRRARDVDAQALADLRAGQGRGTAAAAGGDYPCPCWSRPCARV